MIKVVPYTPQQKAAAFKAIKVMEESQVPGWEQGFITDDLINALIDAVLCAALTPPPKK